MDVATLLIQAMSGAAGGNLIGRAKPSLDLGWLGSGLAGLIGGGVGSQILSSLTGSGVSALAAAAGPDLDLTGVVTQVIGGGVGGGLLTAGVALLRQAVQR